MHALAAAKQAELDAVCCLCLCVTVCADLLMCVFVCQLHKVFGSLDIHLYLEEYRAYTLGGAKSL